MSQLSLLVECDPHATKDIQSLFMFIMIRFMTLLMICPFWFRTHGRCQAGAVNM